MLLFYVENKTKQWHHTFSMTDNYSTSSISQGLLEILQRKTDKDPWLSEAAFVRAPRLQSLCIGLRLQYGERLWAKTEPHWEAREVRIAGQGNVFMGGGTDVWSDFTPLGKVGHGPFPSNTHAPSIFAAYSPITVSLASYSKRATLARYFSCSSTLLLAPM